MHPPPSEDICATASSEQPQSSDLSLASSLRQLSFAIGNVQLAVNHLGDARVQEPRIQETLSALRAMFHPSAPAPEITAPTEFQAYGDDDAVLVNVADAAAPPSAAASPSAAVNTPDQEPHRWYAVIVGRDPGVFSGPNLLTANLDRIPGGRIAKFHSEAEACAFFDAQMDAGQVRRVEFVHNVHEVTRIEIPQGFYNL